MWMPATLSRTGSARWRWARLDGRCANGSCGKKLARMNRDVLCFACRRTKGEKLAREPR